MTKSYSLSILEIWYLICITLVPMVMSQQEIARRQQSLEKGKQTEKKKSVEEFQQKIRDAHEQMLKDKQTTQEEVLEGAKKTETEVHTELFDQTLHEYQKTLVDTNASAKENIEDIDDRSMVIDYVKLSQALDTHKNSSLDDLPDQVQLQLFSALAIGTWIGDIVQDVLTGTLTDSNNPLSPYDLAKITDQRMISMGQSGTELLVKLSAHASLSEEARNFFVKLIANWSILWQSIKTEWVDAIYRDVYSVANLTTLAQVRNKELAILQWSWANGSWMADQWRMATLWTYAAGTVDGLGKLVSVDERKNNTQANAGRLLKTGVAVGGVYLAGKVVSWIIDWFSGDDEEDEDENGEETGKKKKKKKKWLFNKALGKLQWFLSGWLLKTWLLLGWAYLSRPLIKKRLLQGKSLTDIVKERLWFEPSKEEKDTTIEWWDGDGTVETEEEVVEAAENYEEKPKRVQESFNDMATKWVNSLYNEHIDQQGNIPEWMFTLWWNDYDRENPWLSIALLNTKYATVEDLLASGLYTEIADRWPSLVESFFRIWDVQTLKWVITPLLNTYPIAKNLYDQEDRDGLVDRLQGNDTSQEIIQSLFAKFVSVVSYLTMIKTKLEEKYGREFDADPTLAETRDEYITQQLKQHFYAQKLLSGTEAAPTWLISYLKEHEMLNASVDDLDENAKESLAQLEEEEAKHLDSNEEGETIIDRRQDQLEEWTLDEAEVQLFIDDFKERLLTTGAQRSLQAYIPILAYRWVDNDTIAKLYQQTWYHTRSEKVAKELDTLVPVTKESLDTLESHVNEFYEIQENIAKRKDAIVDVRKTETWVIARVWFVASQIGESVMDWFELVTTGDNRQEKGDGALMLAGTWVMVYAIRYPLRTAKATVKWLKLATRVGTWVACKIGQTAHRTARMNKTRLPGRVSNRLYSNVDQVKIDLAKWRISLERALKIVQKNKFLKGASVTTNITENMMLKKMFEDCVDQTTLKKMFRESPQLAREMISFKNTASRYRVKARLFPQPKHLTISVDEDLLASYKKTANQIKNLQWNKATFFSSALKNVRKLSQYESIWKLSQWTTFDHIATKHRWLLTKLWKGNMDEWLQHFGKIMGKNIDQFESMADVDDFLFQVQKRASLIGDTNYQSFTKNLARKWKKYKTNPGKIDGNMESLKHGRVGKQLKKAQQWIKNGIKNMGKQLARSPHADKMKTAIDKMKQLAKDLTPERLKTMANGLGKIDWLEVATGKLSWLRSILALPEGEKILNSLREATDVKQVRRILKQQHLDVTFPEKFLEKIAKSKRNKVILDYLEYADDYANIDRIGKILSHPTTRFAGRFLKKTVPFIGPALTTWFAYSAYTEWTKVAQYNQQRGELKQQRALTEAWIMGIGTAISWALLFVPWVGRVASAAIMAGSIAIDQSVGTYYDVLDNFTKNKQDMLNSKVIAQVQQHVLGHLLRQHGNKSVGNSFQEMISTVTGTLKWQKKVVASLQSSADWVEALLFLEWYKSYPLAVHSSDSHSNDARKVALNRLRQQHGVDYQPSDVEWKNAEKKARKDITAAHDALKQSVEVRYEYLKKKYGKVDLPENKWKVENTTTDPETEKKSTVKRSYLNIKNLATQEQLEQGRWFELLQQLLAESSLAENNTQLSTPHKTELFTKKIEDEIVHNEEMKQLNALFKQDKRRVVMMAQLSSRYVQSRLESDESNIADVERLLVHNTMLQDYIAYQSLHDPVVGHMQFSLTPEKIDSADIQAFLRDFWSEVVAHDDIDTLSLDQQQSLVRTEQELEQQLHVSLSSSQNALFRIANEVLDMWITTNSIAHLQQKFTEENAAHTWIYFNGEQRVRNDEDWLDDTIIASQECGTGEQAKNELKKLADAMNDGIYRNDMIAGSNGAAIINDEIVTQMKTIIEQEQTHMTKHKEIQQEMNEYIEQHGTAWYIPLPAWLLDKTIRAWIPNTHRSVFKRENGNVVSHTIPLPTAA